MLSPKSKEKEVIIELLMSLYLSEFENNERPSTIYAITIGMNPKASTIILGKDFIIISIIKFI